MLQYIAYCSGRVYDLSVWTKEEQNPPKPILYEARPVVSDTMSDKTLNGVIPINKGKGVTSHDVVAKARRILHEKRIGHSGTLDPLASGVLPLFIGFATRAIEYTSEGGKAYRAFMRLGVETTTYDAEGEIVDERPVSNTIDAAALQAASAQFIGDILQTPPKYSALKIQGKRMYELARAGVEFTPKPRLVHIDAITIVSVNLPDVVLDIECGSGVYIRSLAHDIGENLGTGAFLSNLVRTRSGPWELQDCITLEELAEIAEKDELRDIMFAADICMTHLPAAILTKNSARQLIQGLRLPVKLVHPYETLRAYTCEGDFVGITRYDAETELLAPVKMMLYENVW